MATSSHSIPIVGIIGASFWGLLRLLGWVALGFISSLLIAGSLFCIKGEAGSFSYLQNDIDASLAILQAHNFSTKTLARISDDFLNIESVARELASPSSQLKEQNTSNPNLILIEQELEQAASSWSKLILLATHLSLLRFFLFILSLPLFSLVGWWGVIDGLVVRDLRKLAGGRESALLYHRAKSYIVPALCWGAFCYLVLPCAINPVFVLLPFILLFTLAMRLTASRFKKYL